VSHHLHRSAATGRLVTAEFAAANPDTTVTEDVTDYRQAAEILAAAREHLDAASGLLADLQRSKGT
jgi:hypothetical protein